MPPEKALGGEACIYPLFEQGNPIRWPCTITRHRASTQDRIDALGVGPDLVIVAEIERPCHRVDVFLAEQGTNILREAYHHGHSCPGGSYPPTHQPNPTPIFGHPIGKVHSCCCVGAPGPDSATRSRRGPCYVAYGAIPAHEMVTWRGTRRAGRVATVGALLRETPEFIPGSASGYPRAGVAVNCLGQVAQDCLGAGITPTCHHVAVHWLRTRGTYLGQQIR